MNQVHYCWRGVETGDGYESQYLAPGGAVTTDRNEMAKFETEEEAKEHCQTYRETGEVEFAAQSFAEKNPAKWVQ